ncbi:MAG: glycosyltransferase [Beutenbergiaceae bacterium]
MRVVLVAGGSRGDVQPLVALGCGIRDAGHEVTVAATKNFAALVEAYDLGFAPFSYTIQQQMTSELGTRWVTGSSGHPARELRVLRRVGQAWAPTVADDLLNLSGSADLFISGILSINAMAAIATHDGVRHAAALLSPFHPSADGRVTLLAPLPGHVSPLNALAGRVALRVVARSFGLAGEMVRRRLGLPGNGWTDFTNAVRGTRCVLGASRLLVPPATDWPADMTVTGPWPLPAREDWSPDAGLLDFLRAGPTPVYIGFGSMNQASADPTGQVVAQAISRSGVRALVPGSTDSPDESVFAVGDIPHEWLFPRVAAVVHHGGAGTTHAAICAGRASAAVPHMGDQPYWGRRVAELGVGTAPIPLHRLTTDALTGTIGSLLTNADMRGAAARAARLLSSERGVSRAVRALGLA